MRRYQHDRGRSAKDTADPERSGPDDSRTGREARRSRRPRRVRRSRLRRALTAGLLAVGLLAVLAVIGVVVVVQRLNHAVHTSSLLGSARAAGGLDHGPLNFLLIGSNFRDWAPSNGERADSIMVVHVTRALDRAYLVSIPRDLYYTIKPYPATGFAGSTEKIDAALNFGGMPLIAQSVADLTGVKFNGAVMSRFDGFDQAVNALGGVNMCVDEETVSVHVGHDKSGKFAAPYTNLDSDPEPVPGVSPQVYHPGCQHLAAWQALDYVRQRELLPGGDYDRQRHQQQLMLAVLDQVSSEGMLTDPVKLDRVVHDIGQAMTVDTNGASVTRILLALHGIRGSSLVGLKTPSHPEVMDDVAYVVADEPDASQLWTAMRDDSLDAFATSHPDVVNQLHAAGN